MDILLPTDYYLQVCDDLGAECNDRILASLQLADEALEKLCEKGPAPDGCTFTQPQLLTLAFPTAVPASNGQRSTQAILQKAARTCLCLELFFAVTDDDADALGATIRATMPFLFSLSLHRCRRLTDAGVRLLGSYLFTNGEEAEDEEDNEGDECPMIAHLDLAGCSALTSSTGAYFLPLLAGKAAGVAEEAASSEEEEEGKEEEEPTSALLSLALPRAAMDGHFTSIGTALAARIQSAGRRGAVHLPALRSHAQSSIRSTRDLFRGAEWADAEGEEDEEGNGEGGDDDGLGDVSFHEMDLAALGVTVVPQRDVNAAGAVRNAPFDEAITFDGEDAVDADVEPAPGNSASTPQIPAQAMVPTPTRLAAINHRGSSMATRTIISNGASEDLRELFAMIDAYQPPEIQLKAPFMFPGPLGYFPAVHSPDPALSPPPPGPIFVPRKSAAETQPAASSTSPSTAALVPRPPPPQDAAAAASQAQQPSPSADGPTSAPTTAAAAAAPADAAQNARSSMFANFFRSAAQSRSNSPRSPRTPRASPSAGITGVRDIFMPRPPQTARPATQGARDTAVPAPPTAMAAGSGTVGGAAFRRTSLSAGPGGASTRLSPLPTSPAEGSSIGSLPSGVEPRAPPQRPVVPPIQFRRALGQTSEAEEGGEDAGGSLSLSLHPSDEAASAIHRETVDPLVYLLGRVNDALIGSRSRLETRPLALPRVVDTTLGHLSGLGAAMRDPSWNPSVPTRAPLIEASLARMKLDYNVVRRERRAELPTWANAREFVAELLIRPTKAATLSSGAMNIEGTILATTHYDMVCRLWRADTGELLHALAGHENHLSDCAWNAPHCTKIVTASFDKTLKVWDAASGALLHTLIGHELEVVCVAVSPNGRLCASGGMDDLCVVWDIDSGAGRFNLLGHEGEVIAVDFAPCGTRLVTGSMDETVRIWNVLDGTQIRKLEGHTAEVNQVKFNCFGNMVLSGSIDTTCRLWDAETGQCRVLRGHTHEVVDCDFAPDGWSCASASDDSTIRVWDVLTGGCTMLLVGHTQGVCRLVYTADGQSIVSGSLDSTARVWNVATGACRQVLTGHKGLVIVGYNAASQRIVSMSRDNTCRLWRLEDPQNSLAGMAAIAIARSAEAYGEIADAKAAPPTLMRMLEGFFKKLHAADREGKLADVVGAGGRPCTSVPQIPSAEGEGRESAATGSSRQGGTADAEEEEGPEGDSAGGAAQSSDETMRIVNLRARSRQLNITAGDEIRVE